MVDNTENNWKDFSTACIGYFIIMIIYALIGVDLIILSKEFSGKHKDYKSVSNIDYLYPTEDNEPPYTGKYELNEQSKSESQSDNKGSSSKKCKSSDTKSSAADTTTAWPYNWLHEELDDGSSFLHWYKYTLANTLYAGYKYNRQVMKYFLNTLCSVPDLLLILIGPIIIKLIIIVATFCGFIASIFGLLGILPIDNKTNTDTKPNILTTLLVLVILLICIPCAYFIPYLPIQIIFLIPIILICGLFALLLGFMPMFLMLSSIFSLLYPLYFDKGKLALGKFADYKDILSLLYAAGVCILATINLNITVASTMWVGWAILVIMKIVSSF